MQFTDDLINYLGLGSSNQEPEEQTLNPLVQEAYQSYKNSLNYTPTIIPKPNYYQQQTPKVTYPQNNSQMPELTGDGVERTIALLKYFEKFRGNAYWDVNHHRVGYGSSTVTLPDGRVLKVNKDTKVSMEDAERDLKRRTLEFRNATAKEIGNAFYELPLNTQAALTSVAYNFGSITKLNGLREAARNKDFREMQRILRAAAKRAKAKGNITRRNEEADLIGY